MKWRFIVRILLKNLRSEQKAAVLSPGPVLITRLRALLATAFRSGASLSSIHCQICKSSCSVIADKDEDARFGDQRIRRAFPDELFLLDCVSVSWRNRPALVLQFHLERGEKWAAGSGGITGSHFILYANILAMEDARKTEKSALLTVNTKWIASSPLKSELGKKRRIEDVSEEDFIQAVSGSKKRRQWRLNSTLGRLKTVCLETKRLWMVNY